MLVEREAELAALREAAEQSARGEGRLVVIEGPAGIGKTRLLRSACELAEDRGHVRVFTARGTEFEAHIAFGVVRQLLDPFVLGLDERERAELYTGAARLARTVLSNGPLEPDPAAADRYSKINGLFWLVSTLAQRGPLCLAVDDVQWADEPSLEFLTFLARRVDGLSLLLVTATRPAREAPGPLPAVLVTDPGATVLRPAPLSAASVETLVRETAGAEADEDFAAACVEATRGNPFLLSELLREVSARRIAPTAEAARRVGSLAPGGVSAAIELRLGRMPTGARPLAEAVAVLGDGTSPPAAARLAGLEPGALGAAEAALVNAGILAGRDGLSFTHPLVRATVLHGISPSERARLHAAAVELLGARGADPEELATHFLHVEPAANQATVASLRAAATRADALGAPATAAAYLKRALAEPPSGELRCRVLTELGTAEARAGLGEATAHLHRAVEEAPDAEARARAALELARALKFGGEAVRAVDALEALDADLGALEPGLREMLDLERIGLAYISQGARERLAGLIAGVRDPGRDPETPLEAFVLAGLAFDTAAGGRQSAEAAAELAGRALARELIPLDPTEGYGMLIAAVATMWADRLEEAASINERMLDEGRRRGSVVARTAAASMQALVNWRRGRIPDADADSALALELSEAAHGTAALTTAACAVKALVALVRGADSEELARIEADVLERRADPDALPYHLVLHARGLIRVARGEPERGIEDLLECGRVSLAWGSGNPTTVPWRSDAALVLAQAGRRDEARRLAEEELELAESFGARRAIGVAQRALGRVADDESSVAMLGGAVDSLSASPAALDHALALVDLAAAQRRSGDRAACRTSATRAQELAVSCGATALARKAREEAVAAGARPRRVALRGVDALTPSELRVAQRAAGGHTNREIAEDLFVTVKTVEMHLANGYTKLGIRSRTQLPDALSATAESQG